MVYFLNIYIYIYEKNGYKKNAHCFFFFNMLSAHNQFLNQTVCCFLLEGGGSVSKINIKCFGTSYSGFRLRTVAAINGIVYHVCAFKKKKKNSRHLKNSTKLRSYADVVINNHNNNKLYMNNQFVNIHGTKKKKKRHSIGKK